MTWLPPYLGPYERLVQELLHDPFLGSGHRHPNLTYATHADARFGPHPDPWRDPQPNPWRGPQPDPWKAAASSLIAKVSLLELAASLPKELDREFAVTLERSIAYEIDEWCGTPPRFPWWPGPPPPPWPYQIASEIALYAHTLQPGNLKTSLLRVAGEMVQKTLTQNSGNLARQAGTGI